MKSDDLSQESNFIINYSYRTTMLQYNGTIFGIMTIVKAVKLLFEKKNLFLFFYKSTATEIIKLLIYYLVDMKAKLLKSPVLFT